MICWRRPAADGRRRSPPPACRSTPARCGRAICSLPWKARTATATPSSPMRSARVRPARWCIAMSPAMPDVCCWWTTRWPGCIASAAMRAQRFTGRLVAVTGSVGKTTTKEMLRTILAAFGRTHAAVASYNNHWGLPLTLARMPRTPQFCVAEIGMNHAGEIAPLARLARPHVAVITAVEKAHIGFLGSHRGDRRRKGGDPAGTGARRCRGSAGGFAAAAAPARCRGRRAHRDVRHGSRARMCGSRNCDGCRRQRCHRRNRRSSGCASA